MPSEDLPKSLESLRLLVESVDQEVSAGFEEEARLRLRGRDKDDWPVLATALALACPIWSQHTDFFGTGAAIWNTSRIEIFLKTQASAAGDLEQPSARGISSTLRIQ